MRKDTEENQFRGCKIVAPGTCRNEWETKAAGLGQMVEKLGTAV